jgi:hypothetical protein
MLTNMLHFSAVFFGQLLRDIKFVIIFDVQDLGAIPIQSAA